MKNLARKIAFALAITSSTSILTPITSVNASELLALNDNTSVIHIQGEPMSIETEVISEDIILLKIQMADEYHEVYVDVKNETLLLDGKKVNLTKEIVVEEDLNKELLDYSIRSAWWFGTKPFYSAI